MGKNKRIVGAKIIGEGETAVADRVGKPMTAEQAFRVLRPACASIQSDLKGHQTIQTALKILFGICQTVEANQIKEKTK